MSNQDSYMQLMRHKDGQKVVVNETKKHGNGMKMWMIQLTKKGKHWNGGKIEEVKQCTWELKERPKEQFILQNRMLKLNSLPESIVTVIKAKFSN